MYPTTFLWDAFDDSVCYVSVGDYLIGEIRPDTTEDNPQPYFIRLLGKILRNEGGDRLHFATFDVAVEYVKTECRERIDAWLSE